VQGLSNQVVNSRTASMFGWIVGYFVVIWLFGFSIGGPLCAFIQLKIGSREKWLLSLVMAGFAWIFIYGLFDRVLHVPFPAGQLFLWLKLISD
jgi:hypothetical protein